MIQIKAKQQNVSFEKNVEKLAYVLSAHLYNTLAADKVIQEAAKRSGISEGVIKAAWDAAGEVIRTWATEGHNVPLPGLGSMRFSVRSKSVQNVEDVKTSLITARRVVFTPAKEVKDELQATKIAITCYDKDGNIVKRVTSADTNDVEDVKTSLITARRVIFTPSKEVKEELQDTKIAITCYDKDGNIVKRVTSADTNDVEDSDNVNDNVNDNTGGGSTGGNTGGDGGGGDDDGGGDAD